MKIVPLAALLILWGAPAQAATWTLSQALERVLATHPDIQTAEAQQAAAVVGIQEAWAQAFQLTGNASVVPRFAQAGIFATPASPSTQTAFNGTVGLSVPLPILAGSKIFQGVHGAQAQLAAARAQQATTRAELKLEATQAFFGLRKAELLEDVQTRTVAQTDRTLALTRTAFNLGRMNPHEVERAEVNVLNAQGDLLQARAETRQARLAFALMLGLPDEDAEVADTEPVVELAPFGEEAIASQPEVVAAQARAEAARDAYEAAQCDRLPLISASISYQHGNNPYDATLGASNLNSSWSGDLELRGTLSYNLFDSLLPGGKVSREIDRALSERLQAEANLEKVRRNVRLAIDRARIRLQNARERLALAERSNAVADRSFVWVETRFQQGYASQFEVADARGSYLTARVQRVNALIDERLARAELVRALALP